MTISDWINRTMQHEGGYSFDQNDPGGETNYGISKRSYPSLDIKSLTATQAFDIYLKDYWQKMNLNILNSQQVAWKLFDIGVNSGTETAIKMLQRVIGTPQDGVLGAVTASTANSMNEARLLALIAKEQALHYCAIVVKDQSQLEFLTGWIARSLDLGY